MAFRVIVQVQAEHLDKALEGLTPGLVRFGEIHKIPFESSYLLDVEFKAMNIASGALIALMKRGVAFNAKGLGYIYAARFNHMGEEITSFHQATDDVSTGAKELLATRLWPDGCDRFTANLRAECITMRYDWEDQIKNGRRYAMLQLIGN